MQTQTDTAYIKSER